MNDSTQDTVRKHVPQPLGMVMLANERQRQRKKTLDWISEHALDTLRDAWKSKASH